LAVSVRSWNRGADLTMQAQGPEKPPAGGQPATVRRSPPGRKLPVWKKALFGLVVTGLFFAGLELLLGLCGVRPLLYSEDPFVGFESNIPLFVEQAGSDGRAVLATARNKLEWFNAQQFPRHKGANTYRIFCLGGSTTYGRPYTDPTSFCGWLRELLPAADPSRNWEVINAGGISYASYRAAVVMEELTGYEPDLFIVYSGHNEFLERRTYRELLATPSVVSKVVSRLGRTRSYTALKRVLEVVAKEGGGREDGRFLLPGKWTRFCGTPSGRPRTLVTTPCGRRSSSTTG